MSVVEARGVRKRYGELVAVDGLSLEVEAGQVCALLGPNGAGKTTTVEILEGLRTRDAGEVSVLGLDPARDGRALSHRVGVMPQSGDLQQGIKVGEALRLYASFYEHAEDTTALSVRLGLDRLASSTYRRLSGGEKKRLSLALAIVGRPDVAFLDEPTAGMDVEGRAATWAVVNDLTSRGAAVLVTTHLIEEAERHADRVVIVTRGRVAALGSPAELAASGSNGLRIVVDHAIDDAALGVHLGTAVRRVDDTHLEIPGDPSPQTISRLASWLADRGVHLERLERGARSLEDVYLEATARIERSDPT